MDNNKKDITFYFNTLIKSFYSKQLYEYTAQNWSSIGILYIAFVTALISILYTTKFSQDYSEFITSKLPRYIEDFPEIEIKNGTAYVSGTEPYIIKVDGKVTAIVDTTGEISSIDHSEALALLTKTNLLLKGHGNDITTIHLSDIKDFILNRRSIIDMAHGIKTFLLLFVYPSFFLFFLTYNLFLLFLFFPVGIIISRHQKIDLPFRDIIRLTSIALTPSILIKTFFDFFNVQLQYVWLFYFIVAVAYISLAIHTALMLKQEGGQSH